MSTSSSGNGSTGRGPAAPLVEGVGIKRVRPRRPIPAASPKPSSRRCSPTTRPGGTFLVSKLYEAGARPPVRRSRSM